MELRDKIVVITGGTKGLGKAMAMAFLKNDSKVVVCSRDENSPVDLALPVDELRPREENISWVKADVTKEEELKKLADFVVKKFGRLDIWINNAGLWMEKVPVESLDMNRVKKVFEVNVIGVITGSKIALGYMKKNNFGVIVNIISDSALVDHPKVSGCIYGASKWAVNGFTKALRAENIDIKILSIFPAAIKTGIFGETKLENFDNFMEPEFVANKIVENFKKDIPEEELIIRR